jgi:hypothetical protein
MSTHSLQRQYSTVVDISKAKNIKEGKLTLCFRKRES